MAHLPTDYFFKIPSQLIRTWSLKTDSILLYCHLLSKAGTSCIAKLNRELRDDVIKSIKKDSLTRHRYNRWFRDHIARLVEKNLISVDADNPLTFTITRSSNPVASYVHIQNIFLTTSYLTNEEKVVWLTLRAGYNATKSLAFCEDNICRASYGWLGDIIHLHNQTIIKCLRSLVEKGIISVALSDRVGGTLYNVPDFTETLLRVNPHDDDLLPQPVQPDAQKGAPPKRTYGLSTTKFNQLTREAQDVFKVICDHDLIKIENSQVVPATVNAVVDSLKMYPPDWKTQLILFISSPEVGGIHVRDQISAITNNVAGLLDKFRKRIYNIRVRTPDNIPYYFDGVSRHDAMKVSKDYFKIMVLGNSVEKLNDKYLLNTVLADYNEAIKAVQHIDNPSLDDLLAELLRGVRIIEKKLSEMVPDEVLPVKTQEAGDDEIQALLDAM